jgi:hypothetical protein
VWLVIATFLLAAIAAGQAWILATTDVSTRKAADAAVKSATTLETALQTARENFRSEQRPIIWLTSEGEAPRFLNVGDSIGRIAWNWRYTNYGKTPALKIAYSEFMSIQGKTTPSAGGPTPTAPLPPNKIDFSTILSQPTMTVEQYNALVKMENGVGISVRIKYEDAYGASYETDFCEYKLAAGAIAYCEEGNDIK